jgi:hypothetical protein
MSNTDAPAWEKLLSSIGDWSLDDLSQNARQFLEELDKDTKVSKTAVAASTFLPTLFVRLIELLGLPSDNAKSLIEGQEALLFASLAKLLAPALVETQPAALLGILASMLLPNSFPGGPVIVLPLAGMLEPDNDEQWSRVLNDESAYFLHYRAKKLLDSVTEGTDETAQLRWHEIANGHFPLGFNTTAEHRWVLVDLRRVLVPNQPLLQHTPETVRYLHRAATEKLKVLSATPEGIPEQLELHLHRVQTMQTLDFSTCIPAPVL